MGDMDVHFSAETIEWETPQALFDALNAEFGFTCDVAAQAHNAKCALFYTPDQDGLRQAWSGTCWMNPPYGDEIRKWVKKAYDAAADGVTTVCLLPARTDTRWFHEFCGAGEIRFLKGRVRFGKGECGAPFPSMLVIFHGHLDPGGIVKLANRGNLPLIQEQI